MNKTTAVILAGGQGKRMDILCHFRPKPALPFAGGFRVIDFSLSNCLHSGVKNIAVLTDYQRRNMADYLNKWKLSNAGSITLDILEPQKNSYRGTSGAVYQNLEYLRNSSADAVLVLAGDHIYKMDYRKLIAFHRQNKSDVTIGVVRVPLEDAYRFGTVKLGKGHRITEFVEKSAESKSNLASMGIYVFNKEVLMEKLVEDASHSESKHDFGYTILPAAVNRDRVFAYLFDGYWQDIGTKEAYYTANMELLGPEPLFSPNSWQTVLTEKQEFAKVMKPGLGTIKNSLVSPGCVIKGHVENSILSPGVVVEEGAIVKDSIVMERARVNRYSLVNRSILDEAVTIGEFCDIGYCAGCFEDGPEITVVGKAAKVPGHTVVGSGDTIMPHTENPDFTPIIVPEGTTASRLSGSGDDLLSYETADMAVS